MLVKKKKITRKEREVCAFKEMPITWNATGFRSSFRYDRKNKAYILNEELSGSITKSTEKEGPTALAAKSMEKEQRMG